MTTTSKQSRVWRASNMKPISSIQMDRLGQARTYLCTLEMVDPPNWIIQFRQHNINQDNKRVFQLFHSTLHQEQPLCKIEHSKGGFGCSILKIIQVPEFNFKKQVWTCSFIIKVPSSHSSKTWRWKKYHQLKDVTMLVQGHLLDKDTYQYGFCDLIKAKYTICSDKEYLENIGTEGTSHAKKQCQVFYNTQNVEDWRPKQVCRFDLGI